jgi:2-C-methyl-D-erythritol 4-phosphate cytidylyltransferase
LKHRVGAVIVAAGTATRFGADKIFVDLLEKPVLAWSIEALLNCPLIDKLVVVLNENNVSLGKKLAVVYYATKPLEICHGGKRRQDSVYNGLKQLDGCAWILIHDGARPFLSADLIVAGLEAARETGDLQ